MRFGLGTSANAVAAHVLSCFPAPLDFLSLLGRGRDHSSLPQESLLLLDLLLQQVHVLIVLDRVELAPIDFTSLSASRPFRLLLRNLSASPPGTKSVDLGKDLGGLGLDAVGQSYRLPASAAALRRVL